MKVDQYISSSYTLFYVLDVKVVICFPIVKVLLKIVTTTIMSIDP